MLDAVLPRVGDTNGKVARAAITLCMDCQSLELGAAAKRMENEERFAPGLLALLCEREDANAFMGVLVQMYVQLDSAVVGVSDLARKCLDEAQRVLGKNNLR